MATVVLSAGRDSAIYIFLESGQWTRCIGSCSEYTGFGGQFTVRLKAEAQRVLNVIGTK